MDSSRFKRRETQTRRQITTDFRGAPITRSAGLVDPFTIARPASPIQPLQSIAQPLGPIAQPIQPVMQPIQQVVQPIRPPAQPIQPIQPLPVAPAVTPMSTTPRLAVDMSVPGELSPERVSATKVLKSKWQASRKWVLRGSAVAAILVIAVGGVLVSQGLLKVKKVFNGGTSSAAALTENVTPELLKGEGDGRINVLLLGRGGGTSTAPDLTDTIMLASVDPINNTATLLSLPRDFWVKNPSAGPTKINAVWENGKYKYLGGNTTADSDPKATLAGFAAIDEVVEGVIGVPIHYNVIVDFNAFKQAIDTVGGVSVNVPEDLVDPTMAAENGRNPVIAKAGLQKFDGTKALQYSRSRQTSSDFARSQRQRAVLLALKEQVNTLGTLSSPTKLSSLAGAFGSNVQTDLGLSDAARFAQIMKKVDNLKVNSIGLADAPNSFITTANVGGQSVVQPKAGQFDYSAIQTFVRAQLKDPYLQQEQAKIQVYNGTTVAGLALKQADILKSYGYTITGMGNAPTQGYAQTVIVDLSGDTKKFTKRYLEQRFGVTAVTALPDATILPNGADFVIIVGNDSTTINQG